MAEKTVFTPWDIPTRLFHWLLVIFFAGAWLSYYLDEIDWHSKLGYGMLGLLLFRVLWGFVGPRHSRFKHFKLAPATLLAYLQSRYEHSEGHNPVGAWSVIIMLTLLLTQALTGLVNSDDLLFDGPYRSLLDGDLADQLSALHGQLYYVLLAIVGVHITAVLWHQWIKKEALLEGITGINARHKKNAVKQVQEYKSWWPALLCLMVSAAAIYWLLAAAPEVESFY